jgi:hypothetical protein
MFIDRLCTIELDARLVIRGKKYRGIPKVAYAALDILAGLDTGDDVSSRI